MKKILGLDLGTTSIGWALVNEKENNNEESSIIKMGVRLVPLDNFTNGEGKEIKMKISDAFASGISVSTKAARRSSKSARTNNARYKMRREALKTLFTEAGWINTETSLCEDGKSTTHTTLMLRAKAADECISLEELARVLLMINKKRGYKSNRKLKGADEGEAIDGMQIAYELYEKNITPGQYVDHLFKTGKKYVPQFYPSDLKAEMKTIWNVQNKTYPELTEELFSAIEGRNERATWAILAETLSLSGIKRNGKKQEQKIENYSWRAVAALKPIGKEELAIVLGRINADINSTSGYLGNISDRSKLLFFKKQTVGQYLWSIIKKNPHESLKKKVFYREDYLNEFERIWETQSKHHPELTDDLKKKVRNECIFYQRPLKSQKGLIDFCIFESKEVKRVVNGKEKTITEGLRVCPKSSPLFQEFKVLQGINNVEVTDKVTYETRQLSEGERTVLYSELNMSVKMSKAEILKCIGLPAKRYDINYDELPGNTTRTAMYNAFLQMLPATGHTEIDAKKAKAIEKEKTVYAVFSALGFNTKILNLDISLNGHDFEKQPAYQLWHILYSSEGTNLNDHLTNLCRFGEYTECSKIISKVSFANEYGNLSSKALRKLLPFMKQGMNYAEACQAAGYKHSERSMTREELDKRQLLECLPPYKSGKLRNPVVDKVLAQLTNVVNSIIAEYGKPDEIRVEMAREMKKSAKERESMTQAIRENTANAERIREYLQKEFGFPHPTKNDILRWRLYEELRCNGYKTFYSNTYIRKEDVFSKMYDIEHIIPQARLFDDSFANKTLELTSVNQSKGPETAFDYMQSISSEEELEQYKNRVNAAFIDGGISKTKRNHLLMSESEIPTDFIQRDLRETQYITRQAVAMLEEVVRSVVATSGSITDYLREEWQLVDVMKELNMPTYDKLGLVRKDTTHDGKIISRIEGWSKRSDHRHHAMDALTVAFTQRSAIQYLNTLNANHNAGKKRKIEPPMKLEDLRSAARAELSNILISVRSSKKVGTSKYNKQTGQTRITPRGALHAETYYGAILQNGETIYTTRKDIDPDIDISLVIDAKVREILASRLAEYGNDPKKAFIDLGNNPIWLNKEKDISIKKVTIRTKKVNSPIAIHRKTDHKGNLMLDKNGNPMPTDFVAPDANHHIAFYKDEKGKLHERIVTFFEAVERKNQGLSIIDSEYNKDLGWQFIFSLQRGEYVVFPDEENGFSTEDINLSDRNNKSIISPHLFTVQKLTSKDYFFRYHLDPSTDTNPALRDINWIRIRRIDALNKIAKIRLNTLGEIVESQIINL